MRKTILGLLAGAALTICGAVQADPLTCSAGVALGQHPDGLDVSDVSFRGTNATDCFGVVTGTATQANLGFDGFTALLTSILPGATGLGSFDGVDFSLVPQGGPRSGAWQLQWSGGDAPITLDLIAVVQTPLTFVSYFFDDLVFATTPGSGSGTWLINYEDLTEQIPPLASFSLYARDFRGSGDGGNGGGGETPPPTPVDEPATGLLALAGIALAFARRRSQRA